MPKDYGVAGGDVVKKATQPKKTVEELNKIEDVREARTQSRYTTTIEQQRADALAVLQDPSKTAAQKVAASTKLNKLVTTSSKSLSESFSEFLTEIARKDEESDIANKIYLADVTSWEAETTKADLLAQGLTADAAADEADAAAAEAAAASTSGEQDTTKPGDPPVGFNQGGNPIIVGTGKPTTGKDLLKAQLLASGYPPYMIDTSVEFIDLIMKDNPELTIASANEIFLNNPNYTLKSGVKLQSPFYTEYGFLNNELDAATKKSPAELMAYVNGVRNLKTKYDISDKYVSSNSIQSYLKNAVSVLELDERISMAKLKAINADPVYSGALMKLGYINKPEDLTDFFLDPKIGAQELDLRRKNAAFTTEALRRSNAKTGITVDIDEFKKLAAGLSEKGYSEQYISTLAAQGFENISEQLMPELKLSQIHEKKQAADLLGIQQELQSQEFLGVGSDRQKKLIGLEKNIFKGSSGILQQGNSLGRSSSARTY